MSEINEQSGYFQSFDKLEMYYHSWLPAESEADKTKAVFVGIHGGETHAQIMRTVAEYFSGKGYPFYAFDRRGHGHCEKKKRMYVKDYNYVVEDIKTFINFVKEKEEAKKIYLVGHSNGGAYAIIAATRFPEIIDKLILSSPSIKLVGNAFAMFIQKTAVSLLGTIAPKMTLPTVIKPKELVRDSKILDNRLHDELIYRRFTCRWGRELLRFQKDADKNIYRFLSIQ
ncbi:MAG: alpha/beta fold hydrolase [Candidatus Heimdallarchaeota archaeon]